MNKEHILGDIEMKSILVCILLFLLCISVEAVSAGSISAQIDSHDFPSGDWHRGQDQADAHVWIKNTGDIGHRFWVSYEVMDRRGQWYTAPPESVYADPGSGSTWFVGPRLHIPYDAELGSYQADFYLYAYYDSSTGEFSDLLDQVAQVGAFRVVG
jgi:hypothetical protein